MIGSDDGPRLAADRSRPVRRPGGCRHDGARGRSAAWLRGDPGGRTAGWPAAAAGNTLRGACPARTARPDRAATGRGQAPALPADGYRRPGPACPARAPRDGRPGGAQPSAGGAGMNRARVARTLLRLYPRRWRERYGEEYAAVLEQHGIDAATLLDVAAGALDARLGGGVSTLDGRRRGALVVGLWAFAAYVA